MSNRHTTARRTSVAKRRPRWHVIILYAALICLGLGILIFGRGAWVRNTDSVQSVDAAPRQVNQSPGTKRPEASLEDKNTLPAPDANNVDDDGKTLWVSPTDGPPLDLAYLAPGSEVVMAIRPIANVEERGRVIQSLGPFGKLAANRLADQVFGSRPDMYIFPNTLIGLQQNNSGDCLVSKVAYYDEPFTEAQVGEIEELYADSEQGEHAGRRYGIVGETACYIPAPRHMDRIVIAPQELIEKILDLDDNPPPLRRDIERLLAHTDRNRHLTVFLAPYSLVSEGRSILIGELAGLREPLYWFLGDEFSAVALSLHWNENFFIELVAFPNLDTSPEKAARILSERLQEVPERIENYLATIKPHPHSEAVLARFPAMLRTMVRYTRSGFDRESAVLRCYLPVEAGHNLLMATELTLAEGASGAGLVAEATSPSGEIDDAARSIRERLQKKTSLQFPRDTLEAALEQLSNDVGVEIVIRGPDLQADGITKNQQFGIDVENKPAEEILVEILRLANPDKTATSPRDEKQKLVYVVPRGEDGGQQIVVTTRAAAAGRGDELPAVFRMENP